MLSRKSPKGQCPATTKVAGTLLFQTEWISFYGSMLRGRVTKRDDCHAGGDHERPKPASCPDVFMQIESRQQCAAMGKMPP